MLSSDALTHVDARVEDFGLGDSADALRQVDVRLQLRVLLVRRLFESEATEANK